MSSHYIAPEKRQFIITLGFGLITFFGAVLLVLTFLTRSESDNNVLFGFTLGPLIVAGVFLSFVLLSAAVTLLTVFGRWSWQGRWMARFHRIFLTTNGLYWILTILYSTLLIAGGLLCLSWMRLSHELIALASLTGSLRMLSIWLFLSSISLISLLVFLYSESIHSADFLSPFKIVLWGLLFAVAYIILVINYRDAAHILRLQYFEYPFILAGILFLIWALFNELVVPRQYSTTANNILLLAGIFLLSYVLYQHIATWIGLLYESKKVYWDLLASQFLIGKLYLDNPPSLHDLTPYNGKWYLAAPPLPAILMMPWVYKFGVDNTNTRVFSIIFCSINCTLIYLILWDFVKQGWIKLSRAGILWLVILFAFGTNHLWVGIDGRIWFVSQIVTVTFVALSVLLAVESRSPWLIGLSLGLAILARPNIITLWLLPLGITLQLALEKEHKINLGSVVAWSLKSMVPVGLAVAGLLLYNHARFDNFLDFGYTNINGATDIVQNAKTYGIFSPHFIFENIKIMFLSLPSIQPGSKWLIAPSKMGMSIFLSTPPLLYLFHRYEKKWWILGAWGSVAVSFVLLALYHNTGADQFGYRYILDVIVPLIALLAVAVGKRIPWHFVVLTLVSIVINIYGAYWFRYA